METILFTTLFIISAVITVFLFLLSLRKLGSTVKNYASLFTGIDHLLLFVFIPDVYVKYACAAIGVFITGFALVKIIRKMD
jgi:presenilin-like A22 family membrane protease